MGPLRGEAQRQFAAASALALLEAQWSKTCSQLGWSRFLSLELIWIQLGRFSTPLEASDP